MSIVTDLESISSSPTMKHFLRRFKHHNKQGNMWTLETGCLIFTTWIMYLILMSEESVRVLDIVVTVFFILGALTYIASSSLFNRLATAYADNTCTKLMKTANKYLFMVLSFLPGIYFAFQYSDYIQRFYICVHVVTTAYFFYKRFKEFSLEPFLMGFGMSVALGSIHVVIRGFFRILGSDSGWFLASVASLIETTVNIGIAVVFLLDLPRKYLPSNMMFGFKIVKYLMFITYWETWFILMVVATWSNIGAIAIAVWELLNGVNIREEQEDSKK